MAGGVVSRGRGRANRNHFSAKRFHRDGSEWHGIKRHFVDSENFTGIAYLRTGFGPSGGLKGRGNPAQVFRPGIDKDPVPAP